MFWLGAHVLRAPRTVAARATIPGPAASLVALVEPQHPAAIVPILPAAPAARTPRFSPRAEAAVRAALDRRIAEAGRGGTLDDAERDTLVATLARVRRSSHWRQRLPADHHAVQGKHERILLEADHLFRERLGIGIAEFVALESAPGQIEDVGLAGR
jgi:hypothetical protein